MKQELIELSDSMKYNILSKIIIWNNPPEGQAFIDYLTNLTQRHGSEFYLYNRTTAGGCDLRLTFYRDPNPVIILTKDKNVHKNLTIEEFAEELYKYRWTCYRYTGDIIYYDEPYLPYLVGKKKLNEKEKKDIAGYLYDCTHGGDYDILEEFYDKLKDIFNSCIRTKKFSFFIFGEPYSILEISFIEDSENVDVRLFGQDHISWNSYYPDIAELIFTNDVYYEPAKEEQEDK